MFVYQFTNLFSPNHEYFFNKIWCYDYINNAVKCILKTPQDLEKVGWFQSRKKQKGNEYFYKKNSWIGELVNWWHEQDIRNKCGLDTVWWSSFSREMCWTNSLHHDYWVMDDFIARYIECVESWMHKQEKVCTLLLHSD